MGQQRKTKFLQREEQILQTAEQLLLESGEYDLTLDALARHLDLAKGTLYKHFASKDELLMQVLISHEKRLLSINQIGDGAGAGVARMVLWKLMDPQRATLFNLLEEKLAGTASGLSKPFSRLYQIRRERMTLIGDLVERYLDEQNSTLCSRDYLAMMWATGSGGAGLLNSSFYQRYLGDRSSLKYALVLQVLQLPKLYAVNKPEPEPELDTKLSDVSPPKQSSSFEPKLIKPLTPPAV